MSSSEHMGSLGFAFASLGAVVGLSWIAGKSKSLAEEAAAAAADDLRAEAMKSLNDQAIDMVARYHYGVIMNRQFLDKLRSDLDFESKRSPAQSPEELQRRLRNNRAKMMAVEMSLQEQENLAKLAERYAVYVGNEYDKAMNSAPIGDPVALMGYLERENKTLGGQYGNWPKKRSR